MRLTCSLNGYGPTEFAVSGGEQVVNDVCVPLRQLQVTPTNHWPHIQCKGKDRPIYISYMQLQVNCRVIVYVTGNDDVWG